MQIKYKYIGIDKNSKKYDNYIKNQIDRCKIKIYKKRSPNEYNACFDRMKGHLKNNFRMICLGTRNNHERDVFKDASHSMCGNIFSQDIYKKSRADFVGDFNYLSEFVPDGWDAIYSNSIDHALDSEKAFYEWLGVLKSGGVMMLGFSFNTSLSKSDCNSFDKDILRKFFNEQDIIDVIEEFQAPVYYYWLVKKK